MGSRLRLFARALALLGLVLCAGGFTAALGRFPVGQQDPVPGVFPELKDKPKPELVDFNGCPPEGTGGDPDLNKLKNRQDVAKWLAVAHETILDLPWPV